MVLAVPETNGMVFAANVGQEVESVSDIDVENDYTETIEEADETEDDIEENIEMLPEEKQMASDGISEEDGEELFSDNENADDNLEKIVESGTITDTISWTLYDNGTLVISGTGDLAKSIFNAHGRHLICKWHGVRGSYKGSGHP